MGFPSIIPFSLNWCASIAQSRALWQSITFFREIVCETEEISLFCSGKKQDVNQSPEISPQVSVGVERNLSHRCQSHSDGRPGLSHPLSMDSTLNTESPVIPRTPSSPMSHLRGQPSYLRPLCHHYNTQYHIPSPDDCCRVTNHPQNLAASNSQFILLTVCKSGKGSPRNFWLMWLQSDAAGAACR